MAGSDIASGAARPVGRLRLWVGVLGAPAAWFVHLSARYALVPLACAQGSRMVLHAVTIACASAAVVASVVAALNARAARRAGGPSGLAAENAHFMGVLGLLLGAVFLLTILAELVTALLQGPCTGLPGPVVRLLVLPLIALLRPGTALAAAAPPAPGASPDPWSVDPLVAAALVLAGLLYLRGHHAVLRRPARPRVHRARAAAFAGGLAALAAALASPLDALADALFSAHMAQHLLLATVAAPLLALSAPLPTLAGALPRPLRRGLGRALLGARALRRALGHPASIWLLHAGATWLWHIPSLYRAALERAPVHALEHASFLGTAVPFFGVLARAGAPGRLGRGAGVLYAFTASLQCGALGALLAFARVPFYPEHARGAAAWGLGLLDDQRLAGILMWVVGGAAYCAAALLLAGAWLRGADGDDGAARAGRPAAPREVECVL